MTDWELRLHQSRFVLSGAVALFAAVLLWAALNHPLPMREASGDTLQVTLLTEAPVVPESRPEPPKPRLPEPVRQMPPAPTQAKIESTPPLDAPVLAPAASAPLPVQTVSAPVIEQPAPPRAPEPKPVDAAPPPVKAAVPAVAPATYIGLVRARLEQTKRYPTGREASLTRPTGVTTVWLVLNREGRLLNRGLEKSSESSLLDRAALQAVGVTSYPPFPEGLWPGEPERRFTVEISFEAP